MSNYDDTLTHHYTLNGSQVLTEQWEDKFVAYIYDETGAPIGMQYRTDSYDEGVFDYFYFEKNLHGDIIAVYSEAGVKLISYYYDAWGNGKYSYMNGGGSTGAQYNPFRYRGYYYDSDMGFYYLNDRYYDSITGRFLTPDDPSYLGANGDLLSYNLFAYCSNNPVMYVDPTGHSSDSVWKYIIGATLAVGLVAVTVFGVISSGGSLLVPVLAGAVIGAGGSLIGQGVANLNNGDEFFYDISGWSILMSGLAGAAFGTGVGGIWGAISIGAAANAGTSALEQNGWGHIITSGAVGGLSSALGYETGRVLSNIIFKNNGMIFKDFVELGLTDKGLISSSWHAFRASAFTLLPAITPGVVKGISKALGNHAISPLK